MFGKLFIKGIMPVVYSPGTFTGKRAAFVKNESLFTAEIRNMVGIMDLISVFY